MTAPPKFIDMGTVRWDGEEGAKQDKAAADATGDCHIDGVGA